MVSGRLSKKITAYINVPSFGCFKDRKMRVIQNKRNHSKNLVYRWGKRLVLCHIFMADKRLYRKIFGGWLRRGRTFPDKINTGDAIDFGGYYMPTNLKADFCSMQNEITGEAWLDFKIRNNKIYQVATFRPYGIIGRLYWYFMLPFHFFIFNGMLNKIAANN